jgi:KipI family sensor histidine kinase inhibitor
LHQSAKFTPFGDKGLRVELGNAINPEINAKVHALHEAISKAQILGVYECVPAYRSLTVAYDPEKVGYDDLVSEIKNLEATSKARASERKTRRIVIPVVYGGDFGPDLIQVAQYHNLKENQVVEIHSGNEYLVYMIGFIAGFPYLGKLPDEIATPRLETPRLRIPQGSVGIAEDQTGIYPKQAPGGWQIIGRTPVKLFDPLWQPPALLQPGDYVKFKPISSREFWQIEASEKESDTLTHERGSSMKLFRIVKPGFFTTIQDLGRFGFLKFGVPRSGAMDEFSLRVANMLVKNYHGDACLEMTLLGPELEAVHDTQIAVAGDISLQINGHDAPMWHTLTVKNGDIVLFGKVRTGCRAYLAVRGGIDVPVVLGSRSTYSRGEIGGMQGRQLRAEGYIEGIATGHPIERNLSLPEEFIPDFSVRTDVDVLLGPQQESFTQEGIETFLSSSYNVTIESDRMGFRLEGPTIQQCEQVDTISDAILPGSIQVPANGRPIVTMLDAQTTGGYPKIATVVSPDMHALGQAKPSDTISFHETTLVQAHRRLLEDRRRYRIIESKLLR